MSEAAHFDEIAATYVEIDSAVITEPTTIYGTITRLDFSDIGKRFFLVDLVEPDGRTLCSYGYSYEKAILAAEEIARDYGCPVHDKVVVEAPR